MSQYFLTTKMRFFLRYTYKVIMSGNFNSHRVRKFNYSQHNNPEKRSFHHVISLYYFSKAEDQHFKYFPLPNVSH